MDTSLIIISLGLLIFFSHIFNTLFSLTKIPNVLLLLTIGILIGPVFHVLGDRSEFFGEVGPLFTTVTLIVVLFESGVGLKLAEVKKNIVQSLLITVFNFAVSAVLMAVAGKYWLGLEWISAAFLGAIIAGTSSAVVIPMVRQLKLNEKPAAYLFLESALSDVLCLVVGLALLEGIKVGEINIARIAQTMGLSFLVAAVIGVVSGIFWTFILARVREIQNSVFTTFAFVFVVYGIVEFLQLNGGIAVLVFGITTGNITGKTHYLKRFSLERVSLSDMDRFFFAEVVFVLQTYFFVYVGINLEFSNLYTYFITGIVFIAILIIRPLSVKFFATGKDKMSYRDLSVMSYMAPKGLVPAILAAMPMQAYVAGEMPGWFDEAQAHNIQSVAYNMVLMSITICSILVMVWGGESNRFFLFRKLFFKSSADYHYPDGLPKEKESENSAEVNVKDEVSTEKESTVPEESLPSDEPATTGREDQGTDEESDKKGPKYD